MNSYTVDPVAQHLLHELAIISTNDHRYSLHEELIRFKGKVCVGSNTTTQTKIIYAFHSSAIGGTLGFKLLIRSYRNYCPGPTSNNMWSF
jgi:hypothetical protein